MGVLCGQMPVRTLTPKSRAVLLKHLLLEASINVGKYTRWYVVSLLPDGAILAAGKLTTGSRYHLHVVSSRTKATGSWMNQRVVIEFETICNAPSGVCGRHR